MLLFLQAKKENTSVLMLLNTQAFDNLNHKLWCAKLNFYGFWYNDVDVVSSYLKGSSRKWNYFFWRFSGLCVGVIRFSHRQHTNCWFIESWRNGTNGRSQTFWPFNLLSCVEDRNFELNAVKNLLLFYCPHRLRQVFDCW